MDLHPSPVLLADPPADDLAPLEIGAVFLERYTVQSVVGQSNGQNIYQMVQARACTVCRVENDGTAEVCGFCASPLPSAPTSWLIEQRAPIPMRSLPPASFISEGFLYTFHNAADSTPSPDTTPLAHGVLSDIGIRRGMQGGTNQDSVLALTFASQSSDRSSAIGLYLVADGVGGAAAGEIASRMAVETITRELQPRILVPLLSGTQLEQAELRAHLTAAVKLANENVLAYADAEQIIMGTTLALALVLGQHAILVNVGDSRIYLYRDHSLTQLTRDHSYVGALVAQGKLSVDEMHLHPQRNVILKSLGDPSGFDFDVFPVEGGALALHSRDQLLLCSDGLWEMLRDPEITAVLEQFTDPQEACAQLVALANAAGGADNVSAIVVRF